jgi:DNA repair exonuclease SbcCD ATPase subunit
MRLEDLAIFRIREIEHLRLNFGDKQLVAVLGENGSGKTTLLGSIIFLLCGEVIFKGGKERMVRDVGSGDSWVAGTIRHGDRHFKLKRFASSSSCELVYLSGPSSKPIKTPTKVQAELDAMGLTAPKVMRTLLEQGKYGGMFHSTDGDRLRLMFEIFGLTDSDEIQEATGAEATLIPIDVTIDERWKAAQDRKKVADLALSNAEVDKAAIRSAFDATKAAKAVLARAIDAEASAAELNKLRGGHGAVSKALSALVAEVTGLQTEQATLDGAVTAMVGDAAAAEQVVAAMATYKAVAAGLPGYVAASTKAGDTVQRLRLELLKVPQPDADAVAVKRGAAQSLAAEIAAKETTLATLKRVDAVKVAMVSTKSRIDGLAAEVAKAPVDLDKSIAQVNEDFKVLTEQVALAKSGVCPTCKQRLPTAHECMPLEQSEPLLRGCSEQRSALLAVQASVQTAKNAMAVEQAKYDTMSAQVAEAGVAGVDGAQLAGEVVALRNRVTAINAEIDGVAALLAQRASIATQLAKAEAEFEAAQSAIARIDAAKVDTVLYDGAVVVVDEFKRRKSAADARRGVLAAQSARLATTRAELADIEAKIKNFGEVAVVDPVEVERAREVIADNGDIDDRWMAVNTAYGIAEAEAQTAAQDFSSLDVLRVQNEANKKKHELIADMKYLVGVKQFPMFVAGFYVQAINALWAQELAAIDSKFSAWQDETSLEFYGTFHGSDQTRMLYQLSGGERQLASVGYQVVLNKLFAAGVDMIAFDEPSTHVDATYRPRLVHAFTKMLQREDLKDFQIFVVDHSIEFANAISDPIVLAKGE